MAKVVFEFDEDEDRRDIDIIVNRHKLTAALYEVSQLYSRIYNGKIYDDKVEIYIKEDGNVATQEDYDKARYEGKLLSGGEHYLREKYVENELDSALEEIRSYLDY